MGRKYLAMDIGCIECGEDSRVIGIYDTQAEAEEAVEEYVACMTSLTIPPSDSVMMNQACVHHCVKLKLLCLRCLTMKNATLRKKKTKSLGGSFGVLSNV